MMGTFNSIESIILAAARRLSFGVSETDAARTLLEQGVSSELAYLAIKAALCLNR